MENNPSFPPTRRSFLTKIAAGTGPMAVQAQAALLMTQWIIGGKDEALQKRLTGEMKTNFRITSAGGVSEAPRRAR